ncbi:hypothetical protein [Burkholderia guangdongensis]|uniref:hypothetical protein n=1 Tax=Burkholderia guangdongensis TaxID=1792500 RepID=UPI0015C7E526|nr:hypothetical protein [Burkholderia guangdongensis]
MKAVSGECVSWMIGRRSKNRARRSWIGASPDITVVAVRGKPSGIDSAIPIAFQPFKPFIHVSRVARAFGADRSACPRRLTGPELASS